MLNCIKKERKTNSNEHSRFIRCLRTEIIKCINRTNSFRNQKNEFLTREEVNKHLKRLWSWFSQLIIFTSISSNC